MRCVFALLAFAAGLASAARQEKRRGVQIPRRGNYALAKLERSLKSYVFSSGGMASLESLGQTAQGNSIWAVRLRSREGASAARRVHQIQGWKKGSSDECTEEYA